MKYTLYWTFIERPKRRLIYFFKKLLGIEISNAVSIQKFVNKHRGELLWQTPCTIVKLLGWTDQHKEDYYWVVASLNEVYLSSCVGGFYPLKKLGLAYKLAEQQFDMNVPQEWLDEAIKNLGIKIK